VQPVGADDEVDGAGRPAAEVDVHAVGALGQRGDGVVEQVLRVLRAAVVEHAGQVAAAYLELTPGELGR
jgi:hypothetical protein